MIKKKPTYLFSEQADHWKKVSGKLRKAYKIALFLDYDGTLTPIRHKPSAAILAPETMYLLQQLADLSDIHLSVVTGRSMQDIQKLITINDITLIANHGFHILHDSKEWIHPDAVSLIQTLKRLSSILTYTVDKFPKAQVENKQFTLSIHYRNISSSSTPSFISTVKKVVHSYDRKLVITRGKKVLEVRPDIKWGKGNAVLEILKKYQKQRNTVPVFIGDDTTDEDVFRILHSKGITIRVGNNSSTNASYYIKDIGEVLYLLESIVLFRTGSSPHISR